MLMTRIDQYLLRPMAFVATALLAGCFQDSDCPMPNGSGEAGGAESYITLRIAVPSGARTRANYPDPIGGEEGNEQIPAEEYENEVKSVVAFFYVANDGPNAPANTPIAAKVSFTSFQKTNTSTFQSLATKVNIPNGYYHVIAVANPSDDWWTSTAVDQLAEVRDHVFTTAWKYVDGKYSDFVMTSSADATISLASNPKSAPATCNISVKRLAARVRWNPEGSSGDDGWFDIYNPHSDSYEKDRTLEDARVKLEGVTLANTLQGGSYLLRRVANTPDGANATILGKETSSSYISTNYVIDPWTAAKTRGDETMTVGTKSQSLDAFYGNWLGNLKYEQPHTPSEREMPAYWAQRTQSTGPELSAGETNRTWYLAGYALENTAGNECSPWTYSTALVYRARVDAPHIPNYDYDDTPSVPSHVTMQPTFFRVGSTLYASMEDMMDAVYGPGYIQEFFAYPLPPRPEDLPSGNKWKENNKKVVKSQLVDNDPSGYPDYLLKLFDSELTPIEIMTKLKWKYYMEHECGYKAERVEKDGKKVWQVQINLNGKSTRNALRPYGVCTYEDAQCYYVCWIRHSGKKDSAMQYAVVRNNDYMIDAGAGPYRLGGDIPGEATLHSRVYINDWKVLEGEEIFM